METRGLSFKDRQIEIRRWRRKERIKSKHKRINSKKTSATPKEIILPEKFTLENIVQVVTELSALRFYLAKDNKKMYLELNMDKIKEVDISTSLMLAAELDCWSIQKGKLNSHDDSWNKNIRELFYEMGLFDLLNIKSKTPVDTELNTTIFLRFISNTEVEMAPLINLRKQIERTIGSDLPQQQRNFLSASLQEAITNTFHHAYKSKGKKGNRWKRKRIEKWWLSACYYKNQEIIVSLYDRGLTIPTTLEKRKDPYLYKLKNFLKSLKFSTITQAAVHYSHKIEKEGTENKNISSREPYTQTAERNRGKGLAQLLHLIQEKGEMTIISNRDYCKFYFKNDRLISERYNNEIALRGTLIQWKLFYNTLTQN